MSGSPTAPHLYPRRVLLALGGMSPQVVTETLYSLCVRRDPPFVPTEVHLITTTVGREEAIDGLLDEDGEFHEFVKDYELQGRIAFSVEHLHPLRDAAGRPLDDVRTEADNIAAADAITEKIRQLTADPDCALHVSISGGRNTQGFYLGYALSIFGRLQDRLSHVLVPQEFQGTDDFYYPPPKPEIIATRHNKRISTELAEVTLAEIPFVSLRHGLPKALLEGKASYSQTVAAIQRSLAPPRLRIAFQSREIWCGETRVELPPQLFAWYAWMAIRRARSSDVDSHVTWRDPGIAEEFLAVYKEVVGLMAHDYEAAEQALAEGMTKAFFDEKKSRANNWLKELLGNAAAGPYLIEPRGNRPRTRYGLKLTAEQINVTKA